MAIPLGGELAVSSSFRGESVMPSVIKKDLNTLSQRKKVPGLDERNPNRETSCK